MDIINGVLLWLHFIALGAAATSTFVAMAIGARMPAAKPEAKAALTGIADHVDKMTGMGFGALVVTGVAMVFTLQYNLGAMPFWFWVKIALVIVAGVSSIFVGRVAAAAREGDAAAAARMAQLGRYMSLMFLGVIAAAVAAFG